MTLKDLNGRLARWALQLQSFDFDIKHKKGSENVVADTLSRVIEEVEEMGANISGFDTLEFESEEYLHLVWCQ